MSNKSKNKKKSAKTVSIADLLVVIGFVALAFTTFLGSKLLDGDLTSAAIKTILVVLFGALFVWLLCIAKKAQNHRQKWMIVEIGSLVVFVALFLTITGETRHFMYVSENKSKLAECAEKDQATILSLFSKYEQQEDADKSSILEGINSIYAEETINADEETRARLKEWKGDHTIKSGHSYQRSSIKDAAKDYNRILTALLRGDDYIAFKQNYTDTIDKIVNSLKKGADYDTYYDDAHNLSRYYEQIAEELTRLSNSPQKYRLKYRNGKLTSEMLSHTYESNVDLLELPKYFNGNKETSAIGWLLSCGILIFILCAYFATSRSRRVTVLSGGVLRRKKNMTNDGGIDIC